MRPAALIALLFACAGCTGEGPRDRAGETRQQPSTLTPGVHISGHVDLGVVRSF